MSGRTFSMMVAFDLNNAIGARGKLPWHDKPLTQDMRNFRKVTSAAPDGKRNAVIMGTRCMLLFTRIQFDCYFNRSQDLAVDSRRSSPVGEPIERDRNKHSGSKRIGRNASSARKIA